MESIAVLIDELSEESGEAEQQRWLSAFTVDLATRIVNLSSQLRTINARAEKTYPAALAEALKMLPAHTKLEVLPDTLEAIIQIAAGDEALQGLVAQHLTDSTDIPHFGLNGAFRPGSGAVKANGVARV
jgi:hypothetical protein